MRDMWASELQRVHDLLPEKLALPKIRKYHIVDDVILPNFGRRHGPSGIDVDPGRGSRGGQPVGGGRRLGTPLATVSRKVSELEAHLEDAAAQPNQPQADADRRGPAYVAACRRILEQSTRPSAPQPANIARRAANSIVTAPIVFGRLHVLPVVTRVSRRLSRDQGAAGARRSRGQSHGRSCRRGGAHRRAARH